MTGGAGGAGRKLGGGVWGGAGGVPGWAPGARGGERPLEGAGGGGAVEFRVWAPAARRVQLQLEGPEGERLLELEREQEDEGLWCLRTARAAAGTLYRYRVDGGEPLPDPCSRFQPRGVHGPSQVVD